MRGGHEFTIFIDLDKSDDTKKEMEKLEAGKSHLASSTYSCYRAPPSFHFPGLQEKIRETTKITVKSPRRRDLPEGKVEWSIACECLTRVLSRSLLI